MVDGSSSVRLCSPVAMVLQPCARRCLAAAMLLAVAYATTGLPAAADDQARTSGKVTWMAPTTAHWCTYGQQQQVLLTGARTGGACARIRKKVWALFPCCCVCSGWRRCGGLPRRTRRPGRSQGCPRAAGVVAAPADAAADPPGVLLRRPGAAAEGCQYDGRGCVAHGIHVAAGGLLRAVLRLPCVVLRAYRHVIPQHLPRCMLNRNANLWQRGGTLVL